MPFAAFEAGRFIGVRTEFRESARVNLHFIRLTMGVETPHLHEEMTDVWVFGDVAGYRYLVRRINDAISGRKNVHLKRSTRPNNGMHVVLLPAPTTPRAPRFRAIERVVFKSDRPEMELVLRGTKSGYYRFARLIESMVQPGPSGPLNHQNIDRECDWVVQRSVALNIRGAVRTWSRKNLRVAASRVYERQPSFLPHDIGYLSRETFPYEEYPADRADQYLSLHFDPALRR